MKELNNTSKLVRAAGTMKDVLDALDIQIGESQHRTALLKTARRAAKKSIKDFERAARSADSTMVALQAVDNWDSQNTPGVIIDSADNTTSPDPDPDPDTDTIIDTEEKRKAWSQTLQFLYTDPDLQD